MQELIHAIINLLMPHLAWGVVTLIVLAFAWIGITIRENAKKKLKTKIKRVLAIIYQEIMAAEKEDPDLPGELKKTKVADMVKKKATPDEIEALEKEEGSLWDVIEEQFKKYAQPVIKIGGLIGTIRRAIGK